MITFLLYPEFISWHGTILGNNHIKSLTNVRGNCSLFQCILCYHNKRKKWSINHQGFLFYFAFFLFMGVFVALFCFVFSCYLDMESPALPSFSKCPSFYLPSDATTPVPHIQLMSNERFLIDHMSLKTNSRFDLSLWTSRTAIHIFVIGNFE